MARAPRPHTRTRFERRRLPVAHAMRLLRHSEDEGRADGLRQRHDLAHRLRVLPLARLHQDGVGIAHRLPVRGEVRQEDARPVVGIAGRTGGRADWLIFMDGP